MQKLFFLLAMLFSLVLNAQHICGTEQKMAELMAQDSVYAASRKEMESTMKQFSLQSTSATARDDEEYIIPVVVHVIYRLEANNVSMEQIHSQIDALNRDYNLQNEDQSNIPSVFAPYKSSAKFKFVLADKDPDGNFTNGVTRTQTDIKNIGSTDFYFKTSAGGADPWVQAHYVNVWVCEIEGLVLGYAYLPAPNMSERDGIVMAPRAFGTIGTAVAPYNYGRTMVHEMGHYFGLMHLWGSESGSCDNTDHMSDTPTQNGPNSGCQTFPVYSCPSQPNGDMFMNYMDYASDPCMYLFTERQTSFMRLVLNTSRVSLQHSMAVTAVEQIEKAQNQFWIYPNPANDLVHIDYENGLPQLVELLNLNGQVMKSWIPQAMTERIDLSDLPAGVYFIKTANDFKRIVVQ